MALFDVRVTDTDAPFHSQRVVSAILSSAEEAKKRKYSEAAALRRASFTPFVVSVDGVLGREANLLIKHLAQKLVHKWEKSNSEVLGWMRARLSFAILRATNLCLRGPAPNGGVHLEWMMEGLPSISICLNVMLK